MSWREVTLFHVYRRPRPSWSLRAVTGLFARLNGATLVGYFQLAPVYRLGQGSLAARFLRLVHLSAMGVAHGIFFEPEKWGATPHVRLPVPFSALLAHERKHIDQWSVWWLIFPLRYWAEWCWHFVRLRRWRDAYRAISFEREAEIARSLAEHLRMGPCS